MYFYFYKIDTVKKSMAENKVKQLVEVITSNDGWISGSYVREVLVRNADDYVMKDLDVLIPLDNHKHLIREIRKNFGSTLQIK